MRHHTDNLTPIVDWMRQERHRLHAMPELSGFEHATAGLIKNHLEDCYPDLLVSGLGGQGVAALFRGRKPGPRILVRAELDAIPVSESTNKPYASAFPGRAHLCGHDGHMAILLGLARWLHDIPPAAGEVVLLFQPAEETGQGAGAVLEDPLFQPLIPDYVLALHNIPGAPAGQVILRDPTFACASRGVKIDFQGITSHAAHPEQGRNPYEAMHQLHAYMKKYLSTGAFSGLAQCTLVHMSLGEPAYGISPGQGRILFTLRAETDKDMGSLTNTLEKLTAEMAKKYRLTFSLTHHENFPATLNDPAINRLIALSAAEAGLDCTYLEKPFRWSEDFGHFTARYPGSLFGLGAGETHPDLHRPDYDFNDDLLETATRLYRILINKLMWPDPA